MGEDTRMQAVLAVSPGVSTLPLGDQLTLYDAVAGRTLALNRTAADLFALVDGLSSVADIARSLATAYGRGLDEIVDDVAAAFDELLGLGALRAVASPPR